MIREMASRIQGAEKLASKVDGRRHGGRSGKRRSCAWLETGLAYRGDGSERSRFAACWGGLLWTPETCSNNKQASPSVILDYAGMTDRHDESTGTQSRHHVRRRQSKVCIQM